MKKKKGKKSMARKIIYLVLFAIIIYAFIYISNKYEKLSEEKTIVFSDYYKKEPNEYYEIINSTKLIAATKKDNSLIFIGNSTSLWSVEYAKILTSIAKELDLKIKYYDLENDKGQKNSNYYAIRESLEGHLTTTDGSKNNLLAPSFYIMKDGKIKYYNNDTVAMKNTDIPKEYWNKTRKEEFKKELKYNIEKYYLKK